MTDTITIATRESELALWQANFVRDRLKQVHPHLQIELLGMTTQGDRWLDAPLSQVGGKGLFVKELEAAMLEQRADIAVHSVKDLPAELPHDFRLPVLAFRGAVEDVLVSPRGGLDELPPAAKVGSSSLRRQSQLLARRGDLQLLPVRGNVGTRLAKLDSGEYDAIVLAAAGLQRLAIERSDLHILPMDICLPAPGQGALGIECRNDPDLLTLLAPLNDPQVAACVRAERGISAGLGADCSLPVAAHAVLNAQGEVVLRARLASADGSRILQAQAQGKDPSQVAAQAVVSLFEQGAEAVLAELRG